MTWLSLIAENPSILGLLQPASPLFIGAVMTGIATIIGAIIKGPQVVVNVLKGLADREKTKAEARKTNAEAESLEIENEAKRKALMRPRSFEMSDFPEQLRKIREPKRV